MKLYNCIYTLIVTAVLLFCQTITYAQKKSNDSMAKPIAQKPRFSERDLYRTEIPNVIELLGEAKAFQHEILICDRSFKDVLLIRTDKIINAGSSIVNPLSANNMFKAVYDKRLTSDNYELPDTTLKNKGLFKIKVLEQLCPNTSTTVYFITSIKRL